MPGGHPKVSSYFIIEQIIFSGPLGLINGLILGYSEYTVPLKDLLGDVSNVDQGREQC